MRPAPRRHWRRGKSGRPDPPHGRPSRPVSGSHSSPAIPRIDATTQQRDACGRRKQPPSACRTCPASCGAFSLISERGGEDHHWPAHRHRDGVPSHGDHHCHRSISRHRPASPVTAALGAFALCLRYPKRPARKHPGAASIAVVLWWCALTTAEWQP